MREWLNEHAFLLIAVGVASVVVCVAGILASPWLLARLPADYFTAPRRHPAVARGHPLLRWLWRIGKNLFGFALLLLGLAMIPLPGPGMPFIVMGLVMADFPGKYRLERWLVRKKPVLTTLNWARRKGGAPPLEVPDEK